MVTMRDVRIESEPRTVIRIGFRQVRQLWLTLVHLNLILTAILCSCFCFIILSEPRYHGAWKIVYSDIGTRFVVLRSAAGSVGALA
jgi:hypothetical protein